MVINLNGHMKHRIFGMEFCVFCKLTAMRHLFRALELFGRCYEHSENSKRNNI